MSVHHQVDYYTMLSCVRLFATLGAVACQAPLSMGFSRQYWTGLPFPSPKNQYISLSNTIITGFSSFVKRFFLNVIVESIKGQISSQFLKLEIMTDPTTYSRKFYGDQNGMYS